MTATELIDAMTRHGWTAQRLAVETGYSIDTIRSARSGRRPVPDKIADAVMAAAYWDRKRSGEK